MRHRLALVVLLSLSGCVSERHFIHDSWPFGNPNAPVPNSETAFRALGKNPAVTPIAPQAGDVWPGPVQPMPTIGQVEQQMNVPLGQGYTPSLPSPYPPGVNPDTQDNDYGLPAAGTPAAPGEFAPVVPAPDAGVPGAGAAPSVPVPNQAPLYNGNSSAPLDSDVPGHVRNGSVGP